MKVWLVVMACAIFLAGSFQAMAWDPDSKIIINQSTSYENAILDLGESGFYVTDGALLQISHSVIRVTLSPENPSFIDLDSGKLMIRNCKIEVRTRGISPASDTDGPVKYYAIRVAKGSATIAKNHAFLDSTGSAGFFRAGPEADSGNAVLGNTICHFHGGVLLSGANRARVENNHFERVSGGNIIVVSGKQVILRNNRIFFPGNGIPGDGIDVLNSENIVIRQNYISSGYCYSVYVAGGRDITIDSNHVTSGITYAIYIDRGLHIREKNAHFSDLSGLLSGYLSQNRNIHIAHNYFAQNRYGVAANDVDGLVITKNIFVQRFTDSAHRRFWTDNRVLLKNVLGLRWQDNIYREAIGQNPEADNRCALRRVDFPASGGVLLPC